MCVCGGAKLLSISITLCLSTNWKVLRNPTGRTDWHVWGCSCEDSSSLTWQATLKLSYSTAYFIAGPDCILSYCNKWVNIVNTTVRSTDRYCTCNVNEHFIQQSALKWHFSITAKSTWLCLNACDQIEMIYNYVFSLAQKLKLTTWWVTGSCRITLWT